MRHHLIQVTWACQNACSYCWVERTVRLRPEQYRRPTRPLEDWVNAIKRDKVELVDIAGGEPLLTGWVPELIAACPETTFGLSTNGVLIKEVERLAAKRLPNLNSVNVSFHPETAARVLDYMAGYKLAVMTLATAGYPSVHGSIVDYGSNVEQSRLAASWLKGYGLHYAISPYEDMSTLTNKLPEGLVCKGGEQHLTVAPDGEAWPCLTALRSPYWAETSLGNWLDGTVDLSRKPQPCYLNCIDWYVLRIKHPAGDMWGVEARPAEVMV